MGKDIEKFIKKLKKNDIRMTSQRYAILQFLAMDGNHPTANDVYNHLKEDFPKMSIATVYNNLNFFKESGIVQELPFGEDSSRFDLTETQHYHAVCKRCGKVVDFDYAGLDEIEATVEDLTNFKVDSHDFKVMGLCEECQRELNQTS